MLLLFLCAEIMLSDNLLYRPLEELTTNRNAKSRAKKWGETKSISGDESSYLSDIENIGKGRFAQRLATNLSPTSVVPEYVKGALKYVKSKIQ